MFGRGVFLKGENFHSIVIVVPLHVSKFYRVIKKLTAYIRPRGGKHKKLPASTFSIRLFEGDSPFSRSRKDAFFCSPRRAWMAAAKGSGADSSRASWRVEQRMR
jgi:hypothetical protein